MEFSKIAEIIGARDLLVFTGILISLLTVETMILGYLIYWAGGLRNLFSLALNEYNHCTHDTRNKRNNATPSIK
jgi:hypothetical protein